MNAQEIYAQYEQTRRQADADYREGMRPHNEAREELMQPIREEYHSACRELWAEWRTHEREVAAVRAEIMQQAEELRDSLLAKLNTVTA